MLHASLVWQVHGCRGTTASHSYASVPFFEAGGERLGLEAYASPEIEPKLVAAGVRRFGIFKGM